LLGGRASPYAQKLNGEGNRRIRDYVENGGKYLGLCAGAYYAGAHVEFAQGTKNEIIAERELGFFPEKVVGPALAEYDYHSEKGAKAARINRLDKNSKSVVYYNGGGFFAQATTYPNVTVIDLLKSLSLVCLMPHSMSLPSSKSRWEKAWLS
jgi:biotin--protein ligase